MSDQTVYIYGLIDPQKQGYIKYLGVSEEPERRLKQHIYETKNAFENQDTLTQKQIWIASILIRGIEPHIVILEAVDISEALDRETEWINFLYNRGHQLTNISGIKNEEVDEVEELLRYVEQPTLTMEYFIEVIMKEFNGEIKFTRLYEHFKNSSYIVTFRQVMKMAQSLYYAQIEYEGETYFARKARGNKFYVFERMNDQPLIDSAD